MMKKLRKLLLTILSIAVVTIGLQAAEISNTDIPANSYVIGTHLYTSAVPLTTKHIMLASKTINGHTLDDMKVLYKTSRSLWMDGLSGESEEPLATYTIDYEDSTETTQNYTGNYVEYIVSKDDIPGNSYVIGTHLFTYEMPLTTRHIMIGAQTIVGNTLSDMQFYYKTSRGVWMDGLSGETVSVPDNLIISHVDLSGSSKEAGYVTLSGNSSSVGYGIESVTFNIEETHGGEITVTDNNDTATTSIDGNTVTVSNLSEINADTEITVTVTSAETDEYTEASATYTITILRTMLGVPEVSIDANGTVTWTSLTGASSYEVSFDNVTYVTGVSGEVTIPLTSSGEVTVYVKAVADANHITSSNSYGSATVNVYSLMLTGDPGIDDATGSGNYVSGKEVTISATLNNGYIFNGWTVTSGDTPSNVSANPTTVTLTQNTVLEATTVEDLKEAGHVTLSESEGSITYGETNKTFNITSTHGGEITVTDNNDTATASVDGNIVTVSNLSAINAGTVITITVTSAETDEYTEASATYTLTVNKALLGVPEVSIDVNGTVTWTSLTGASSYEVSFDNATYVAGTSGNVTIPLTSSGEVTAYVRGVADTNHITSSNSYGSATVNVYSLMLTGDPGIDDATGSGNYVSGKEVTISATLNNGYIFNGWTVTSGDTPSNVNANPTTVTLTQNTVLEATTDINTLTIKYHSDGGTWNPSRDTYIFNTTSGYVERANDNSVYTESYNYGASLPASGLMDCNGGYFYWTKDDASIPSGSEYYIDNNGTKTYFDQTVSYTAADLATAAGCNLSSGDCVVDVEVNWVPYIITDGDYLSVSGINFVKSGINGTTGNGKSVALNGFNLGEWLSRAISLSPIDNVSATSCSNSTENAYAREYPDNNVQINYALTRNIYESEIGTLPANGDLEDYLVFTDITSETNEVFKKVFEINEAYYSNFINEDDIAKLAEMGVTAVRVPVEWSYFAKITKFSGPVTKPQVNCGNDYSSLDDYTYDYTLLPGYNTSTYEITKNSYLDRRMKHLDWIVEACRRNGIYVVFDLHVVPGSVNSGGILDNRGGAKFFETESGNFTASSLKAQEISKNIWKLIAKRFEGNPGVAGYELINEPGYPRSTYLFDYYDTLYDEIRSIDNDHIIIMESPMKSGINHYLDYTTTGLSVEMPMPSANNWENVAYAVHDYFDAGTGSNNKMPDVYSIDSTTGELVFGTSDGVADDLDGNGTGGEASDIILVVKQKVDRIVSEREKYGVPIYVSEVNWRWNFSNTTWPELLETYNANGLSYAFWAYKVAGDGAMGLIYNLPDNKPGYEAANLLTDDYTTLVNKFSRTTLNGGYEFNSIKNYYGLVKDSWLRNVEIQYNGNGGTWNGNSTYSVIEAEGPDKDTVIMMSNGSFYKQTVGSGILSGSGLVDYNGSWFNWTKEGYIAMPGAEYYVVNQDDSTITYFDQAKTYTAREFAVAQGCSASKTVCTVRMYVNWKDEIKVALIGNSKTFYDGHPNVYEELTNMLSDAPIYTISKISREQSSLLDKANYSSESEVLIERTIANALNGNSYDIAILQEKTAVLNSDLATFDSGIAAITNKLKTNNSNVMIYLRESWQNNDSSFDTNQEIQFDYVQKMSHKYNYDIIHDGKAFSKYAETNTLSDLFNVANSDNTHASYKGAYLAAACLYSKITRKAPGTITYNGNDLTTAEVAALKNIARDICYQ